ncbi:hypothetical protein AAFG13_36075 [Bradyrhizobium sp. B124]|uniref:hypothetical protein n=1 Tax=Bradyrhizobium sp. B124 TaxID=3140245 RepID=UPI003183D257
MRAQEVATEHAAERMALHAAHKSESDKPFARAAGVIFALLDRVPELRSVIAPLRRNPKINPAERQRTERDALDRRHGRENYALDRRYAALGRLDAWELRSLENSVRRQVHEMEAARGQKAETLQERIEVNELDITLPADSLHAADVKQAKGWKRREQKAAGQKTQKRPKGYRLPRDDP